MSQTPHSGVPTPDPPDPAIDWERLQQLFDQVCELPPQAREEFLDRECAGSAQIRKQIELLMQSDAAAGQFMAGHSRQQLPISGDHSQTRSMGDRSDTIPLTEKIGRYKLLQVIGEGGFGTVFLAEQEEPIRRRVAVKVIKLGMDTRAVVARFEAERQALAMMDHPNIARVIDAGATQSGRPYFVMELVNGVPITQYCDANSLTARERLELFIPVCHAVQHAHQKGIIHRDLKPSNVLITMQEDKPVPKVIDFGIAKATQARLTERTLFTELQKIIGTPQYMSPEQANIAGIDIDTRSDIYSLGVMLYELLTGTTPLDARDLRQQAYDEMQRIIREVDPPLPSSRVSTLARTQSLVATQRRTDFRQLQRVITGELDWVVMKCLEKNRTRRYDAAAGLAADLSRYLLDEPVSAARPSKVYQFQKYVRRHRMAVTAALLIAISLLAGITASTIGFVHAARQRTEANRQRAEAVQQRGFAELQQKNAEKQAAIARKASLEIIRMAGELGLMLENQGELAQAEELFQQALGQARNIFKPGDPEIAREINNLGDVYSNEGKLTAAEQLFREALALQQNNLPPDSPEIALVLGNLGTVLERQKRPADAEPLHRQALEITRHHLSRGDPDIASHLYALARTLSAEGKYTDADPLYREAISICRSAWPGGDVHTAMILDKWATMLLSDHRPAAAEAPAREAVEMFKQHMPASRPEVRAAEADLAAVLKALNEPSTRPW